MNWTHTLDYENTAFRCIICTQIGHLQNLCPEAKNDNNIRKRNGKLPKGWNFHQSPQDIEEEEAGKESTQNFFSTQ